MANIKIISYNPTQIIGAEIANRIEQLGFPHIVVNSNLILVNYSATPNALYDVLNMQNKRIFIGSLGDPTQIYWGYQPTEVWNWLSENLQN